LGAQLGRLRDGLVDFLFPVHCLACGSEGSYICRSCGRTLPRLLPPVCLKCGRPLIRDDRCSVCARWKLEIDGIRSVFVFQGLVRRAVHQFKYNNLRALAFPLADLVAGDLKARPLPVDVVVAVPLHRRRLRGRGYNQSALLARELSQMVGLPLVEGSLVRVKDSPAQVKAAGADERRENVRGAFSCRDGQMSGRHVLLIDDVCTTGATLDACAVALKAAGASSVWGLTLAREA